MHIRQIEFATPEYDEAIQLRTEVLRRPLGLEFQVEELAQEYDQIHLAAFDPTGRMVAYLNLTPFDAQTVKVRQVAVSPALQGSGIGRSLSTYAEAHAKHLGYAAIVLHARDTARIFYEKMGYEVFGEPFEEVTIPHVKMRKDL
jgi:predicted GNAT family N-acyltransferase